jgi:uncharacterized protein YdeI (YjbR/CyaY-like superfamily)
MTMDARVDAYIAKSAPFAQPILWHLRTLVHKACPEVEETIKWSMPFYVYKGVILGNMAAFKAHCSFGLWGSGMSEAIGKTGERATEGMGTFGRLESLKDLPADKVMLGYLKHAVELVASGKRTKSIEGRKTGTKPAAKPVEVPAELTAALKKNKAARKTFEAFSPSCKREYVDWIVEAKREETKLKRVAQAVEWMAEGKQRNWKYQDC